MRVSVPANVRTQGSDFSQRRLFQEASTAGGLITEAGIVDLTTYQAVAAVAQPVRDRQGHLLGVVVTNLRLDDFSSSLRAIVDQQMRQQKPLDKLFERRIGNGGSENSINVAASSFSGAS